MAWQLLFLLQSPLGEQRSLSTQLFLICGAVCLRLHGGARMSCGTGMWLCLFSLLASFFSFAATLRNLYRCAALLRRLKSFALAGTMF